jgi:hypothetical protein
MEQRMDIYNIQPAYLEGHILWSPMWSMEAKRIAAKMYIILVVVAVVYVFTNRNQLQPLPPLP